MSAKVGQTQMTRDRVGGIGQKIEKRKRAVGGLLTRKGGCRSERGITKIERGITRESRSESGTGHAWGKRTVSGNW